MKKTLFLLLQFCAFSLLAQKANTDNLKLIKEAINKSIKAKSISYDATYTSIYDMYEAPIIGHYKVAMEKRKSHPKPKTIVQANAYNQERIYFLDTMQNIVNLTKKTLLIDSANVDPEDGYLDILQGFSMYLHTGYWTPNFILEMIENAAQEDLEIEYLDSLDYLNLRLRRRGDHTYIEHSINRKTKTFDRFSVVTEEDNGVKKVSILDLKNIQFNKVNKKDFEAYTNLSLEDYPISFAWDYKPQQLLSAGTKAPQIEGIFYPNYNGEKETLKYDKITIIDFWFATCLPCMKAVPMLNELQAKYKDKLNIIGVNPYDTRPEDKNSIEKFLAKSKAEFPFFLSEQGNKSFNVSAYPTLYVIDKDGQIIFSPDPNTEDSKVDLANFLESYFSKN